MTGAVRRTNTATLVEPDSALNFIVSTSASSAKQQAVATGRR
jgi:hypothetical protein